MVVKMETKRKATLVGIQNKEWVVVQGSVGAMIERDIVVWTNEAWEMRVKILWNGRKKLSLALLARMRWWHCTAMAWPYDVGMQLIVMIM
jgi:hypothetical protein